MVWLRLVTATAGLGGALAIGAPVMAGSITIAPNIQNSVSVQNAQQFQLGFGVDRQEAVLIQEQGQAQVRNGRPRAPRRRGPNRRTIPINKDIVVAPSVQNAVSVQNGQQIQLALPRVRSLLR